MMPNVIGKLTDAGTPSICAEVTLKPGKTGKQDGKLLTELAQFLANTLASSSEAQHS
ncbi:hypothetical protein [Pontibacterium sp.]|uniref:hypothetical protein n=1 Tax=Pontibacterium sp. TaxID=2036026 RepID=UPI0035190207